MANRALFSKGIKADTINNAGGAAYGFSAEQALAQLACTGCLNSTFYVDAADQLEQIMEFAQRVRPEFAAKVALHARSRGHMKDAPALIAAILSVTSPGLMAEIFDRVIDSPKMLRNFVQIMRSGRVARKSLGSLPKRLVEQWLARRSDDQIFRASVGGDPSLADIIRMVHPSPSTESRSALYAYLIGKTHDAAALPEIVKQYEAFKHHPGDFVGDAIPDVPMEMLTSLNLSKAHWNAIARRVSWQTLRMNLNTFTRHGAFDSKESISFAADRLRDRNAISRARVFPYQLMAAYRNIDSRVPLDLAEALQDAMEIAIENVPSFEGEVVVMPDVSGSMRSSVTGSRQGATSKVRCVDVAGLVAAAILRKNPRAKVIPFSDSVLSVRLNSRDSVLSNAEKLASLPAGGTNCSAPLAEINRLGTKVDLAIFVSDNESWIDDNRFGRSTESMNQWQAIKARCPKAKLVCLDIQPNTTTQVRSSTDVLNVGGFSDAVFDVMASFVNGSSDADHWVRVIEKETI